MPVNKILICIVFMSTLVIANSAISGSKFTESEIRQKITNILSQRDPVDTPDWWRSLGPEATNVIISMHKTSRNTYHKIRLLQALAWFDDPVAAEYIKEQIRTSDNNVIKGAGIKTLGISQGEKELDYITNYLNDQDQQLRYAAAQTLKRMMQDYKSQKASMALDEYKKKEKTSWIIDKLNHEAVPSLVYEADKNQKTDDYWRGFWIVPDGKGLLTENAFLLLEFTKTGELIGTLTLDAEKTIANKTNGGKRIYSLTGKKDISGGVTGTLKRNEKGKKENLTFRGSFQRKPGVELVQLQIEELFATLIMRR